MAHDTTRAVEPGDGPADAPVPVDQRPLPGAPRAGICQAGGHHGRLAATQGGHSLNGRREIQATLTSGISPSPFISLDTVLHLGY